MFHLGDDKTMTLLKILLTRAFRAVPEILLRGGRLQPCFVLIKGGDTFSKANCVLRVVGF